MLGWMESGARLDVHWVVLGAVGERAEEARASAQEFLDGAATSPSSSANSATASSPIKGPN